MTLTRLAMLLLLIVGPGGCVVSTISGAASKERPVGRSIDDTNAGIAIHARLRRYPGDMSGVRVAVEDGFVLLTGNVKEPQLRLEAERIAWGAPKVIRVANEIEVAGHRGFFGNAKDRWITTQVRSRILSDTAVRSLNVNIETRNRKVYLLGLVRTQGEIARIANHASLVPGVTKVISYLQVAPDRARKAKPEPVLEGGPEGNG